LLQWKGNYPAHEIAEKLGFGSVEAMCKQLKTWELPDWLMPEEASTGKAIQRERKARHAKGEPERLPPATNASTLFKDALRLLESEHKTLSSIEETWQGGRFMSEAAGGPEKGIAGRGAAGGQWFPNPEITRLIGVCLVAFASSDIVERLLKALHPSPAEANRKQLYTFFYGIDPDAKGGPKQRGDGFLSRWVQTAALIRGMPEIGRGVKDDPIGAVEQYIAWEIRARRDEGLSEEETARRIREAWGLDQESTTG
jgi:hypothetical protein